MWRSYANGFLGAGFRVVSRLYDERKSPKDLATFMWKVYGHRLLQGTTPYDVLRRRYMEKTVSALSQATYDAVVVISGALIDSQVFSAVRQRGVPVITVLEDQLDRLVFLGPSQLRHYDAVATFSKKDAAALAAQGVNAHCIPFGFDERYVPQKLDMTREVTFVGTTDDYRIKVLEELNSRCLPVRAYGQQWSRSPVARLRDRCWSRPDVPGGPRLRYEEAKRVYQQSLASLNLHVRGQDLMNPRTFDIAGVGGLQLTDRPDVSEFYEPGKEVLVFNSPEEVCDHVKHAQRDPHWARGIRTAARRRTLAEHTVTARCRQLADLFS